MILTDGDVNLIGLQDWINHYKGKQLTYYKGYLDTNYSYHVTELFDNFFNEDVFDNIQELSITGTDKIDFQYNPKGLSQALYGTPDMWFLILKCNNLDHAGELDLIDNKVKVPKRDNLEAYLGKVMSMMSHYFGERGMRW